MNRGDRHYGKPLPVCPKCGMDSGRRMATTGAYERYVVRCTSCGAMTHPQKTQSAATRNWGLGYVK